MRGPPGSGKSTTIQKLGLQKHTLSSDMIRQLFGAPVLDINGEFVISSKNEREVWKTFDHMVHIRMKNGELLVLDATHASKRNFYAYYSMAKEYGYKIGCIDFADMPLEIILERNAGRPSLKVVPEDVVRRMYKSCKQFSLPKDITVFAWDPAESHLDAIQQWLNPIPRDFSQYKKIHHIGDLQGCYTVLQKYLPNELPADECFIFVGDICDRGVENGKTLAYLLQIYKEPNVFVLYGNHETHLENWSISDGDIEKMSGGDEFIKNTRPQLLQANIQKEDVQHFISSMYFYLVYHFQDKKVLVTHAGLSTIPENFSYLSPKDCSSGTSSYGTAIDKIFTEQAPGGWFQVHGHRNVHMVDIMSYQRSFNLEGRVEHGGHLCILTLDHTGFRPVYVQNDIYKEAWIRIQNKNDHSRAYTEATWVTQNPPLITPEDKTVLDEHPLIKRKPNQDTPNIVSYNFTSEAFFTAQWDTSTVKARGLFIDQQSREIVARSYEKFFNLNERPETKEATYIKNARYPIQIYLKENGFLGILGYDRERDSLVFASKSTTAGPFAECFQRIFTQSITLSTQCFIKTYLKESHSSMVFEVIDPIFDPHIISYDKESIILLDVIRRTLEFESLAYKKLKKLAKKCSLKLKELGPCIYHPHHLQQWLNTVRKPDWSMDGKYLEGFVLQDKSGFLLKIKLDYYNHWKRMRSLKDRIRSIMGTGKKLKRALTEDREKAFAAWCYLCPKALLEKDIITLRNLYTSGWLPQRDTAFSKPDPKIHGFQQALTNLEQSTMIKTSTADSIFYKTIQNPLLSAILREHRVFLALFQAASKETKETWLQKYPFPMK